MEKGYDSAMTRRGTVIAAAVATAVIAACSSSGNTVSTTPPAPPTVVTPTEPDPTTTVAPTTTESPATTTTTIDPAESLAADVEADYREAYHLGKEASQDPSNGKLEQAALDLRLGVIRDNFAKKLTAYRDLNQAIRPNDAIPATITVEVPAHLILPSTDVAELQVCEIDSWIVVEVGSGPSGSDAVVNADVGAYRSQIFMRKIDDTWKYEGGNEIGRWEGVTACPAE